MKNFFERNKTFLGIVIAGLIMGLAIYFSQTPETPLNNQPTDTKPKTCQAKDQSMVTKIIDGDTLIVEGGYSVRLLGIDADERGYPCYEPASQKLENLVLNKEVVLEKDEEDIDQYGRCLRYVFLGDKNINQQLVAEGLAIARFSAENVKYRQSIADAEQTAKENKVGCKWSPASSSPGQEEDHSEDLTWRELTPELTDLKIIDACQAGNYLDQEVIVQGRVVDSYHSSKSNTVFLNLAKAYPNQCFTAVIFSSNLYKFVQNPQDFYADKTIRLKGLIKEYQGKPEIILKSPKQIELGR